MRHGHHEDTQPPTFARPLLALSLLNLDMSALEAYVEELMKKNRIRTVKEEDIVRATGNASFPPFRQETLFPEESSCDRFLP
ncbi:hypothetical protein [Desulfofustis glycolicus]|uniref:Uncharacterized protein n=1 Tax=Desulfofustis glycolicus DSM 9705 TaxID=1121409 RepID=A0A1M5XUY9_9BACT|nr:hypothetical protein [Desulfofustis glycolicus]MCB2217194.1 hypothetical protein [Desulfobulbaceae bacterium]SHI03539.1 hypothetical protein SAMN02745124_03374 [Desulfofustis glycolicus DSM 9705]